MKRSLLSLLAFLLCFLQAGAASSNSGLQEQYKFMHIGIKDGLSNNQVRAIMKDSRGFMWFGTDWGLNRYDGTNFKVFTHQADDSTSITFNSIDFLFEDFNKNIWMRSNTEFAVYDPLQETFHSPGDYYAGIDIPLASLQNLYTDRDGNLWFITTRDGVFRYSPGSGKIAAFPDPDGLKEGTYLNDLGEDKKGNFWAVSNTGTAFQLEAEGFKILQKNDIVKVAPNEVNNFQLYIDRENDVWFYSPGSSYGVFHYSSTDNTIRNYTDVSAPIKLNNNQVSSVEQDANGLIWLATDHGGVNLVNKHDKTVSYLKNNSFNPNSISQNSVTYLYKDPEGIIWAGTFKKGINYYHPDLIRFAHYTEDPGNPKGLPFNDVNCFAEDKAGNLWIGTNGGGLVFFDRANNTFTTWKNEAGNARSLSNNVIVSLLIDHEGILWIGTYLGGLNRFDGKEFKHFRHDQNDSKSISDDRVWEIFEDSKRNLWIGTLKGGLDLFDRQKNEFIRYTADDVNSIGSNFVMTIGEDAENNLWLGTSDGVDRMNLATGRFYHYEAEPGKTGALSDPNASDLLADSRGYIWIATRQGLNIFSQKENLFRLIDENEGLASACIKTVQEDQHGNIWVATNNGISKVSILNSEAASSVNKLELQVHNFSLIDGLQGKEYNEKAAYRTRSGELIFGGANGFNLFIPENITHFASNNKIVLTTFQVFNREVKPGRPFRRHSILEKSITETDAITLRHSDNVFSLGFAALNYFHPEKNIFEYRLAGFNNEWLKIDRRLNEITFTNLNAGDYKLQLRVSNDGYEWNEMQPPLAIRVLPSFWASRWAYTIYLLIIIAVLFLARKMMLDRHRLKYEAEQEHREAARVQQLDALKTRFFTNVSHEFRTPLSLIISPIEKLIGQEQNESKKETLVLIHRNARRLLAMVNQLLDFRKLEVQKLEAKNSWGELVGFVRDVSAFFDELAENKQIRFYFKSNVNEVYTFFDHDKLFKIVSNLLSNAFKFTPESGTIKLETELEPDTENPRKGKVKIVVSDTGIGIEPDRQQLIFERFYQSETPDTIINQGSGIGLSMVSEYVSIIGGTVALESIVGKGSTFTVQLPVELFSADEINERTPLLEPQKNGVPKLFPESEKKRADAAFDAQKNTILLVEDNPEFRFYLKDNLQKSYNILEAANGAEGWEKVEKHLPNLVVSDVMMPVSDGIELCSKIKNKRTTRHIPVVLLTARVETDPEIDGYESGADAYIAKPFDFRILVSRIENLIHSREQLRLSYQSMIGIKPEKVEVNSQDEKFIKRALEIVEHYISEPSFSVEDFSLEMGMSRVSLYKKMLALTDKTPTEFLRIIRLKRAADLLSSSHLTVSEIAYKVGFNNPRYFSKYFKTEYGQLPSEYLARNRPERTGITEETREKYN